MKEENPWIRNELEFLERNVEEQLLQLGWAMEQDVAADCNDEEEGVIYEEEYVAGVSMVQE